MLSISQSLVFIALLFYSSQLEFNKIINIVLQTKIIRLS